jgi:hypothetical protein
MSYRISNLPAGMRRSWEMTTASIGFVKNAGFNIQEPNESYND